MTEVTLINPPLFEREPRILQPPLNTPYLAAVLEQNEIKTNILDFICWRRALYKGNDSLLWKMIGKELQKHSLDIVGITCQTLTFLSSLKIISLIKQLNPHSKIVLGGPFPTVKAREILEKHPEINVVVRGEGEETFLELAQTLEHDGSLRTMKGITYRENGCIRRNPDRPLIDDLDKLPFPARHLQPLDLYKTQGYITIFSSRGCPYNCIFCVIPKIWQRQWRARSPANVVDELALIAERYGGFKRVFFVDDLFDLNAERVEGICAELNKRGLDVQWGYNSRADLLTKALVEKMYAAGCREIRFGAESGSAEVLKNAGKAMDIGQLKTGVRRCMNAGMYVAVSFMFGLPGETNVTARTTLELAKELNAHENNFSVVVPYPGTELYERPELFEASLKAADWYENEEMLRSGCFYYEPLLELKTISGEEIKAAMLEAAIQELKESKRPQDVFRSDVFLYDASSSQRK
jgi:radical SAM superfamily enzyme YgiQ (UPF0313 family)